MEMSKGERALMACLVVAIMLLLGFSLGQPVGEPYYYPGEDGNQHWYEGIKAGEWIMLFLTFAITAATIGMWVVSAQQRRLIASANATANQALTNSTTAERGWIQVWEISARPVNGAVEVHYRTENIGRSPIRITGEWVEAYYISEERPDTGEPMTGLEGLTDVFRLIGADRSITTWETEGAQLRDPILLPIPRPNADSRIVFRGQIRYQTSFGAGFRYGFTRIRLADETLFRPVAGGDFDVPDGQRADQPQAEA